MKEIIERVFEEKIENGTIEKIISDNVEKMIEDICKNQMGYCGEVKKKAEEKLKPIMLNAIENSNFDNLANKITMLINEGLKNSPLDNLNGVFDGVKNLFGSNESIEKYKDKKVIKISELFGEYLEYVKYCCDESDFESDEIYSDDEYGAYVDCTINVAQNENQYAWRRSGYIVELSSKKSSDTKSLDLKFKIDWNYNNTNLRIKTDFYDMTVTDLKTAPPFIILLWYIEHQWKEIEIDIYEDNNEIFVPIERY